MEGRVPPWLASWQSDALARVEQLRGDHKRERGKLELQLETNPLENSFSDKLVDLMRREEAAAHQQRVDLRESLADKVDTTLAHETRQHFSSQSTINQRRWHALLRQQNQERELLAEQLHAQFLDLCQSLKVRPPDEAGLRAADQGGPTARSQITDEEFAAEERRVNREATANTAANERFHLETAFALQLKRVEAEWSAHEAQMRNDYETQRAELQGRRGYKGTEVASPTGPWKSKEKQALLIHTAPVHEPNVGPISPSSKGGLRGSPSRSKVETELRMLEDSYTQVKARAQHQKHNAQRWIHRQSQRMLIQLSCVERDKKLVAQHEQAEEDHLLAVVQRQRGMVAWLSQLDLPTEATLAAVSGRGAASEGPVGLNKPTRPTATRLHGDGHKGSRAGSFRSRTAASRQEALPTLTAHGAR